MIGKSVFQKIKSLGLLEDTRMLKQYIFLGLLLGLVSFWNGAVTISGVLIIAVYAILKRDYKMLALPIVAVIITQLLLWFFVGFGPSISPHLAIGFLAADKSIVGISSYYLLLLGILPVFLLLAFLKIPRRHKIWFVAFLAPFFFANLIQISPDLTVNHKFINVSTLLLNIFVAYLLARLFTKSIKWQLVAATGLLLLTASGVADIFAVWNFNNKYIAYDLSHPVTIWAEKNTNPDDTFLTGPELYNPILWAGRNSFLGWHYFADSAGYDVRNRSNIADSIYRGGEYEIVQQLLHRNNIDYLVISPHTILSTGKPANYSFFENNYSKVFFDETSLMSVYQVL